MTPPETRERLLAAAEQHFAEHGFAGASLRQITADAEANLAAVSYHFGSKEELFVAAVARILEPINRWRNELLDQAEARAGGRPIPVEELVEILVRPILQAGVGPGERRGALIKLFGRMHFENASIVERIFDGPLRQIRSRIESELRRSLPHLSARDVAYRMHFVAGAAKSAAGDQHMLRALSRGLCDAADLESTLREIVRFLAAGMSAPASFRNARSAKSSRAEPRGKRAKKEAKR